MQARRNTNLEKEQQVSRVPVVNQAPVVTASVYCIQLKEVLSNSWQGFFEGLEFETLTNNGKKTTVMRGIYTSQDEFQKILKQLEEMNLHYQKVTVDTLENYEENNQENRLSTHTWIHEPSKDTV